MTRPRDIADSINRINSSAADATAVTIDSSENVGIGLTDPDTPLEIQRGSSGNALKLSSSADGASVFLAFEQQESGTKHVRGRIRAASNGVNGGLIFETGASSSTSERIRIDNDGNFLVGKTSTDFDGGVFEAGSGGTFVSRSGTPFGVNRNSSEGAIQNFYKDGTQVGEIGVIATNNIYITNPVDGLGLGIGDDNLYPVNGSGGANGDSVDLGDSTVKFNNIYAVNGTIQTSDQNKKQQIASLTDAEINAAKAISKLFKTFKFNDSVEAKGDNARTHAGVIAQEVRTALEAEGLDATKYAFFCSDTWWETTTEVPAVEPREAVYDDDGNLVSEAIEIIDAVKAHTRREIYKKADEAPEGATQKTLLGIRYPELLAFIGAATEQRLTSIEARLTALENE